MGLLDCCLLWLFVVCYLWRDALGLVALFWVFCVVLLLVVNSYVSMGFVLGVWLLFVGFAVWCWLAGGVLLILVVWLVVVSVGLGLVFVACRYL